MPSRRASAVAAFLLVLGAFPSFVAAQCKTTGPLTPWQCYEARIVSSVDLYNGGAGNPYRDLTLRVTFNNATTGASFTQDAFWGADTANPTFFYVRTALPPGNWSWSVAGCSGTTGGRNCSSGVTWSPGALLGLSVTGTPAPGQLCQRGFPTQVANVTGSGTTYGPIVYGDGVTPIFWAADTAWSAPGFEASGTTTFWNSYVADRKAKLFNFVLLAPAALAPQASQVFVTSGSCTDPAPNNCSIPNIAYWKKLDTLISTANQSDIAVLMAGTIDPLDRGVNGSYPRISNAVSFSRYLAARLAGFAVLFSPGFDDRVTASVAGGGTVAQSMNAVGAAIRQAAPRALVTNHLNGGATCTDYEAFRTAGWMTFFFFHSGHAINTNGSSTTSCPGYLGTETNVNAALRRAWQIPLTLRASGAQPVMPSYNAEGPYDALANDGATTPGSATFDPQYYEKVVDIRYHLRQACFLSALTGALGCAYGNLEIAHWSSPLSYLNRPSALDIGRLYSLFRTRTAGLYAHPEWIANQPATTFNGLVNSDTRLMALASDGSSLVLAYVPARMPQPPATTPSIQIRTTGLPTLGCTGWTFKWMHAQNLFVSSGPIGCTGSNPISISLPAATECSSQLYQDCDWILQIQRTSSPGVRSQLSALKVSPQISADTSADDGTSVIFLDLDPPGGPQAEPPVLVSSPGVFQQSPVLTRLPKGFLTVWHAEDLDGSLLGVFGRVLSTSGALASEVMQINTTTSQDQRDPTIDSDPQGNAVVAWSSYDQDGDLGGIFARLFDAEGKAVADEFAVNSLVKGNQAKPQVAFLPGGNFVVAWQTDSQGDEAGALSFRIFSPEGKPITAEIRPPEDVGSAPILMDLSTSPTGLIQLRWSLVDSSGADLGARLQWFNAAGLALGAAVSGQ